MQSSANWCKAHNALSGGGSYRQQKVETMEEIRVGLMVALLVGGFIALWDFKLEATVRKTLRQHLDKESKEVKSIFIDPRKEI